MKRIDVQVPENIETRIGYFKQAEEIKTWSKACLKLIDLGLRYYLKKDKEDAETRMVRLENRFKVIEKNQEDLFMGINKFIESNNKK